MSVSLCHLRTRDIFRTLLDIYDGAFCSEPCVTLAYLEPWHVQNLRNIWILSSIYDAALFWEPYVTLAYLGPWYIQNLKNN